MVGILAIYLLVFPCNMDENSSAVSSPVQWLNLEKAVAKAKTENKPLFIYFRAEWCVYCKKMEQKVFKREDVHNYINEQFIPVRVDGGSNGNLMGAISNNPLQEFRKQLNVSEYPAFIILSPKGELITRWSGYSPESVILSTHKFIH